MQDSEATALSEATAGDVVLPWLAMAKSENAENAGHAELESDLCCVVPSVSSELSIALGQAGDDVPFSWDAIKSYEMVWSYHFEALAGRSSIFIDFRLDSY